VSINLIVESEEIVNYGLVNKCGSASNVYDIQCSNSDVVISTLW